MEQPLITLQETMQLHELLTFKNISLTKTVTMSPIISDEELKGIIKNDTAASQKHIQELSELMKHSPYASADSSYS
jgi:similar to spore coat protein